MLTFRFGRFPGSTTNPLFHWLFRQFRYPATSIFVYGARISADVRWLPGSSSLDQAKALLYALNTKFQQVPADRGGGLRQLREVASGLPGQDARARRGLWSGFDLRHKARKAQVVVRRVLRQPDKLTGYLEQASNALANDGMLQRFQVLVYPDPVKWEYRDAIPNEAAREQVNNIFEKLDTFDPVEWDANPANEFVKFPHFRFDRDAQEIYIDFSAELHRTIEAEDNPLIQQHLAKYDKLYPALALVLHLVDCAASDKRGPVTKAVAIRAAAWCRYLETHARRCYGLIADEGLRAARELAKHLKGIDPSKTFDPENFTVRDIRQRQCSDRRGPWLVRG